MNREIKTSLELAKELKKLGVKQDSEFYWYNSKAFAPYKDNSIMSKEEATYRGEETKGTAFIDFEDTYSAFLSSELGELLPNNVIHYSKDGDMWCALYGKNLQEGHGEFAETEADSRAKMLIYLLEQTII